MASVNYPKVQPFGGCVNVCERREHIGTSFMSGRRTCGIRSATLSNYQSNFQDWVTCAHLGASLIENGGANCVFRFQVCSRNCSNIGDSIFFSHSALRWNQSDMRINKSPIFTYLGDISEWNKSKNKIFN